MSVQRDVRHGAHIARAELTRSVREYFRDRRRIIGLGLVLLFFGGNSLFALPSVYVLGQTARAGEAIPYFGAVATLLPIGLLLLAAARTAERIGNIESGSLILMTVHPRAVVIGLIGSEIALLLLWFGIPLGAVVTTFGLGMGAPSLFVTTCLLMVPLICWAAVWGYACGIGVLRLLRRLPALGRVLKTGGVPIFILVLVGTQIIGQSIGRGVFSIETLLSTVAFEPLSAYAALAFVGTPLSRPIPATALTVAGTLIALTPLGLAVATRQASTLWFTDGPSRTQTVGKSGSTDGFTAPQPFAANKTGRIAWGHLRRGVRSPQEFGHLMMVLPIIAPLATTVTQSPGDALGLVLAGVGVAFGTYLAGAMFCLNPLGDDRPQFPLLLLTETPLKTFVWGRMVAGISVGLPIVVLTPLVSILIGTAPLVAIGFATVGTLTCLCAPMFAVGIGTAYPIYEEREFWGTETVVPSTAVMMLYSFVVMGGTVLGLVLAWLMLTGTLSSTLPVVIGFGLYLLVLVGVPFGSYRYAIRRYRQYSVNQM